MVSRQGDLGRFLPVVLCVSALAALAVAGVAVAKHQPKGQGQVSVSPSSLTGGATGKTLGFTFKATTGGAATGGTATFTFPSGWAAPHKKGSAAGRISVSPGTCSKASISDVSHSVVTIGMTCKKKETFTLAYGGLTVPPKTGKVTFKVETADGTTGPLHPIESSPVVTVTASSPVTPPSTGGTPPSTGGTPPPTPAGPGPATHFNVTAPSSETAGAPVTVSVTALDQSGNVATAYSGTLHFTSSDGGAALPSDSTLSGGTRTFSVTLGKAGLETITATDITTSSISGSATIGVSAAAAGHFVVSAPATATAGSAFTFTVTAVDPSGNTDTGYGGTVHFTTSAASSLLPANATLTNGTGTFSVTLNTSGNQTITATDTASSSITGTSHVVAVSAGGATHFAVSAPSTATAGTSFNVTVTALDAINNVVTGYTGTVHFTSSDGQAVLPANATLANGVGTFTATLKTAGGQTITATDTVASSITGTSSAITVSAIATTHFAVTAPATATAGTAFNFSVTALDQFDNVVTGYSGTVQFAGTDPQAVLPANATLTNGVGTFSATLKTAGTQTITATDTVTSSITGTSTAITVSASAPTHFAVSAPATATGGTPFTFTVTALDQFNNTATSYTGSAHFTSTDSGSGLTLPADSTLSNGTGTFSATLVTPGPQTLTATDTTASSITGTSGAITVSAPVATHFSVTALSTATAGVSFNITVSALDASNHIVTGYSGTVHFTSTDGLAVLPANATLTNGVGTFSATLKTAGTQTITATDTVTSSITGTSSAITVSAGAASHFSVSAPVTATGGSPFTFTVTALDQFGNTATSYAGTVHFTSTDSGSGVTLPADSTLSNGTGTFSATLVTPGPQTLTATDTTTSSIAGTSGAITVSAPVATHFSVTAPSTATAGASFNITVSALDASNHVVTGYPGTVHFTSSDGQAVLPANTTLFNGTGTFVVTLKTAGFQSITATDTVTSSITGTWAGVNVSPGAAAHLSVSAPSSTTAGTAFNFTVTALDQFGNVATGYSGTVHFTSTDSGSGVTLPADSPLSNGTGTFSATLVTPGPQTLTATDTTTSSITGTSGAINVG